MSSADVSRRWTMAARRGIASFLAIAGIVAIVFGLLYLSVGAKMPHLLLGHVHRGRHLRRAEICLVGGGACVAAGDFAPVKKRACSSWRISKTRHRSARILSTMDGFTRPCAAMANTLTPLDDSPPACAAMTMRRMAGCLVCPNQIKRRRSPAV